MNKKPIPMVIAIVLIVLVALIIINKNYFTNDSIKNETTGEIKNADIMKTDSVIPIVVEENVKYFGDANGYFVYPKAPGNYPGIVMIHENRGLRPEIKETAETLAKEGYRVLAVDLLGGTAEDQTGARALTSKFAQATGTANMRAAAEYLRAKGATKIASIGWCFGGKQSIELAVSGEKLDATIVYYGGGMATTTARLAPIKWPVLGIFGDKDQAIPVTMVRAFENSLKTLGIENEIHIYPGVGHAFANPSGMNYAPKETMDAWKKTLDFLAKNLKG